MRYIYQPGIPFSTLQSLICRINRSIDFISYLVLLDNGQLLVKLNYFEVPFDTISKKKFYPLIPSNTLRYLLHVKFYSFALH